MRLGGLQQCSIIDYPDHISAIVFTIGCNFRCPYCHNPELVEETATELSTESFFDFLVKRRGKLDAVTITGGEPTMHDDLLDFIFQIKSMGFKVKLDTNGTRPDVVTVAVAEGMVDYVAVDAKAPLSKYSATVTRPVDVDAIRETRALLLEGRVPYEFRTTVVKSLLSPEEIEEIAKEIEGAEHYYLQRFVPTKLLNPAFMRKTTYSNEEFLELQKIASKYVQHCGIR
ncbi:MAG: anaerobic ribonucleoside-triphosphate reductase activating protein [Candidatus Kaiserbacteria bacterium]|nr:anaerobic ribonucleoside-triphosphate reductase activating protein [Candidatus Kaiserbacteria bacterium]MCB9816792.1 anaerobic ribonucleoside-triphosphate reductase activating protein [Candidatus Nomurabacteria bacterium]